MNLFGFTKAPQEGQRLEGLPCPRCNHAVKDHWKDMCTVWTITKKTYIDEVGFKRINTSSYKCKCPMNIEEVLMNLGESYDLLQEYQQEEGMW